jgi:hypothetical protein
MSVRDMAIEVGEKQFYDLVFTQFSAAVHSTWQHIWRFNLLPCRNPLHMGHRVPLDPETSIDCFTFTVSARYLCKLFAKFDAAVLRRSDSTDAYACYDRLVQRFREYFDEPDEVEVPDTHGEGKEQGLSAE